MVDPVVPVSVVCGVLGLGLCVVVVSFLYASWYGNMLHTAHDGWLIKAVGFRLHMALMTVVTRVLASCGGVTLAMDREARHRLQVQQRERVAGPDPEAASAPICFFGDSEFACWHRLRGDMRGWSGACLNAGFGGSRTCDLLRHAQKLCFDWSPRMVFLHCSGNDWDFRNRTADSEPRRRRLAARVCDNLLAIVQRALALPSVCSVFLILTPRRPTYSDAKWRWMCHVAETVRAALGRIDGDARCIDLRGAPPDDAVHYRADRSHLNLEGHSAKAAALLSALEDIETPASASSSAAAKVAGEAKVAAKQELPMPEDGGCAEKLGLKADVAAAKLCADADGVAAEPSLKTSEAVSSDASGDTDSFEARARPTTLEELVPIAPPAEGDALAQA